MEKKKEKILFVIPTASINGAIIVLMDFFDYLVQNHPAVEIEIISQWGKDKDPDAVFRNKLSGYGRVTFMQELDEEGKEKLKKE